MTRRKIAGLLFQCLRTPPPSDAVEQFATLRSGDLKTLLLHLDQTGLAIYLLNHLVQHNLFSLLAPQLQDELDQRLQRNQARRGYVSGVRSSDYGLRTHSLERCGHEGFSLIPDYTPAICLRHQTDVDLHIDAASIEDSREVLEGLGYSHESDDPSGEMKFVRQLGRPFTGMLDIYSLQSASRCS